MANTTETGTTAGPGGIIWHTDPDLGRSVWVRVQEAEDGRYEVVELLLDPWDGPITTDHLRRIPLGRIEAFANSSDGKRSLQERWSQAEVSICQYVARMRELHQRGQGGHDDQSERPRLLLKLPVPRDKRSYGDDFYVRVAHVYGLLAERGRPPAPAIAEANDVPVTTARRWVREARIRGFLAPGRPGKVG